MRVALITDGIWPYVLGGMQKHSYYLCKYLAQQHVQVHLFHFNQSSYDIALLEFFSEEERRYITATVIEFPKSLPFPGHYLYNSYRHSKRVFKTLGPKVKEYDFIYTKGFTGWYLIEQKHKGRISAPPVGVKFHGYEMFQTPPSFKVKLQHWGLLRRPVRSISLQADKVFSYGGKITDIIQSLGVPRTNIIELPSGVEKEMLAETITPTGEIIRFLFLGRYERRKGIEELNQAINELIKQPGLNAEFQFIGPIPEEKRIAHQQVVYHGEIRSREGVQELMRKCDVLLCPSWSEGMPNVILEAMAAGLAVVATNVGATNVLVSERTGWLLKEPNPLEIQGTLENILRLKPADIDMKKQQALDLIRQKFAWEKLVLQLLEKISH